MSDFASHIDKASSEKIGLVIMRASYRLTGWSLFAGSVYSASIPEQVVERVTQDGTALSEGTNADSLASGEYFLDRRTSKLFVRTTGDADPDSVFLAVRVQLFFSNIGISAPHDLASGFEVEFAPIFTGDSTFSTTASSTRNLLGVSLTSGSKLTFVNDSAFWGAIFDKYTFETQRVDVYSWGRGLPASQAQIIYKGIIQQKQWTESAITFEIVDVFDELRGPIPVTDLSEHPTALIPNSLLTAKQRTLYGKVLGHVLTPIDQVTPEGYTLTGTISVTGGGTTVTGFGTSFLAQITPGDDLFLGSFESKVRVESVASDTSLELSEVFAGVTISNGSIKIVPSHNKRYANRKFLVAGHALARPSTTVSAVLDAATVYFADLDFPVREGDFVEIGGQQAQVRVLGSGFMQFVQALDSTPIDGDSIFLPPVANVHLSTEPISLTDDYTYDATTALVTLDELAEFNIAPIRSVTGDITISNGSRDVTGSGTIFTEEFGPGDWIKGSSNDVWFEILEVTDDTNLILRTTPGSGDAVSGGAGVRKNPNVVGNSTVVSADCFGKADDSGNLLQTAGAIAKDILSDAGLSSDLDSSSFDTVDELAPYRIGVAIPSKFSDKKTESFRDVLNQVCRSTFTAVVLNEDYKLEMRQVSPEYEAFKTLDEGDLISVSVNVDSNDIVARAKVSYAPREYDPNADAQSNVVESVSNAAYLADTVKETEIDTILVDQDDAEIMSSRWAFLLERATSSVRVRTSLQAIRWKIGDVVQVNYSKFFERFGSQNTSRLGMVMGITKTIFGVQLVINDLGNSFSRVCRIAGDGSSQYSEASDDARLKDGFITDDDGFTESVTGINLIW